MVGPDAGHATGSPMIVGRTGTARTTGDPKAYLMGSPTPAGLAIPRRIGSRGALSAGQLGLITFNIDALSSASPLLNLLWSFLG